MPSLLFLLILYLLIIVIQPQILSEGSCSDIEWKKDVQRQLNDMQNLMQKYIVKTYNAELEKDIKQQLDDLHAKTYNLEEKITNIENSNLSIVRAAESGGTAKCPTVEKTTSKRVVLIEYLTILK